VNAPAFRHVELEDATMSRLGAVCALVAACFCASTSRAHAGPPRADQADTGYLDVASDPPAKIAIDGADTGQVTPQSHVPLKAGHHKLGLVTLDGAHSRTIGFTVQAGQTTKLTVHLAQ